jgi:hypothetical protein
VFWWKFVERHDKAANLHEVGGPVRKTFSTKWQSLIFFAGFFFLSEVSSGDEKGIDFFYQRGFLRLWCFHSSPLEVAKKYIIAESSLHSGREKQVDLFSGVFPEEVWSYSSREKQVDYFVDIQKRSWFFTAARKNKWIFGIIFELSRLSQQQRKTFS